MINVWRYKIKLIVSKIKVRLKALCVMSVIILTCMRFIQCCHTSHNCLPFQWKCLHVEKVVDSEYSAFVENR
jgi:hypothetical protein